MSIAALWSPCAGLSDVAGAERSSVQAANVCSAVVCADVGRLRRRDAQVHVRHKARCYLGAHLDGLSDAAIAAIIVAATTNAYKALGKPCACPEDTMRNGRRCGGNSAYSRPGGYRPLCYTSDGTRDMICRYRTTKAIPSIS